MKACSLSCECIRGPMFHLPTNAIKHPTTTTGLHKTAFTTATTARPYCFVFCFSTYVEGRRPRATPTTTKKPIEVPVPGKVPNQWPKEWD